MTRLHPPNPTRPLTDCGPPGWTGCRPSRRARGEAGSYGFTMVELLVVIAIIGMLTALLLPVLGKGKSRGQQVACVNNFHQLTLSWKMYADENGGKLVSIFYFLHGAVNSNAWVRGSMNDDTKVYPPVEPGVKDSTNLNGIKLGSLYQYNHSAGVYHCPADTSMVDGVRRVRSYSLNGWMGGTWVAGQSNYIVFKRDTDIVNPSPSKAWVFIDEHDRSINDGWFAVDMKGERGLLDAPATRHNNSYALSFADCHGEIWKLRDHRSISWTILPIGNHPINPDWQRLQEASSSLKP
jgi:prepilin-type N-terminal cleavage/methylation domain-containing protein